MNRGTLEDAELDARNARPDLFALADDLFEAELIRSGRLSIEPVKTSGPVAA